MKLVALALERGVLQKPLPAVRVRYPLAAGFAGKYHVSPLPALGHRCFDVVCLGKQGTLLSSASFHSGLNEYMIGQRSEMFTISS